MRFLWAIFYITLMNCAPLLSQDSIVLKMGAADIRLEYIGNKFDSLVFLNLHSNEQTSIKAIKQVLPDSMGLYYGLLAEENRELNVVVDGEQVAFDPNRVFTKNGINKTLKRYSCHSEVNCELANEFALNLITLLSKAKTIIAVHNSTDGDYCINSILESSYENSDIEAIHINPTRDEDDFYLVTQKEKFDYFKERGYNVVLQDNLNAEDDGSLSVYCGRKNIDYINIECENGHVLEQVEMIKEVYRGFYNKPKPVSTVSRRPVLSDSSK